MTYKSLLAVCLLVAAVFGCGKGDTYQLPGAVSLSGTLTNEGEILTVEGLMNGTGMIVVSFHPVEDGKPIEPSATAWTDAEGKFEIPQGIEPGEYVISIRQWEPYPENDLLKGKFSVKKSPIKRTIDADTVLNIDIANPEGE